MLTNATIDGLYALGLPAIARGLVEQRERPDYQTLSFEDRLGLLVDLELQERENRRLLRSLKAAKLRSHAVVEDIDFRRPGDSTAPRFSAWPNRTGWPTTTRC